MGTGDTPAASRAIAARFDTKMVREGFGAPQGPVSIGIEAELYVATSPDLEGVTGQYFDRTRPARANPQAYDAEARRRLWQLTDQLVRTIHAG